MAIDKPSDTTEFQPSGVTELTQELRLATTITGGVSLAIWMAGVVRELNLLAQASEWRRWDRPFPSNHGLSDEAAASLKLYAQLIDLLDTVVDVDVLSGTSAGGIGAALLASSRVTGSDLGGLRDLWLDLGALTDLLRNPTDKNIPSLLYGDQRMFAALAEQIPQLATGPFPPTACPRGPREPSTTLYATTTLLTGETSRFTDSYGTLVQDVDRRGVFTFTQDDLAKKDIGTALALAARSSASFPLAFEPSFIPFGHGTVAKGGVPARPPMEQYANITRPHWVADGGLLDNQPIDVLLQRIFDRRARRPVRRVLLFVVPSAGPAPNLVKEAPVDSVIEPLGLVDGLLKDLSAATTQSIAAELRTIRAHQDRMEARTDTKLRIAELGVTLRGSRLLTPNLLADYGTREATKQAQALTSALLRQLSTMPPSSSGAIESIPAKWEPELEIGGCGEGTCCHTIKNAILECWSRPPDGPPLPESLADLARYGQSAYDLAKGCALAVVDTAYRVVASQADHPAGASRDEIEGSKEALKALTGITEAIHAAWDPPAPIDLGELVRSLCSDQLARQGSLEDAAAMLANLYLERPSAQVGAWDGLGRALIDENYLTLKRLAESVASVPDEQLASLAAQDQPLQKAVGQLKTYLTYLHARNDRWSIARKLFDLAVTQRAMLPSEADLEQSLELVQVSADTRSLLAPDWQTAQDKLTGMQFHHFGAFYKRSWRANDWMWGRLDGAGWLVHLVLDPRRVRWIVSTHADEHDATEPHPGARWFLRKLKAIGAPDFSGPDEEGDLLEELAFLDDRARELPPSIPNTAMWLAQPWQQRILDEELEGLAKAVLDPEPGKRPDWSPTKSRSWANGVVTAKRASEDAKKRAEQTSFLLRVAQEKHEDRDLMVATTEAKTAITGANGAIGKFYALLNTNPVARETLATDKGSPLMAQTITKAAATASAAVGSIRQLPSVLRPPLAAVRTVALGGFRVVSSTKGIASRSIIGGAVLLVLGVAIAILSSTALGPWGLILAGIGGYAIVLGAWQLSTRLFFSAIALTLLLGVLALTTRYVREWLFGTDKDHSGVVGAHVYWLATQWWHPLIVIGAVALAVTLVGAINPRRK